MNEIDAIYRHGVFEPLQHVNLAEDQKVRLSVEPANSESSEAWLDRVQKRQNAIRQRQGILPDSAPEIAEDRLR